MYPVTGRLAVMTPRFLALLLLFAGLLVAAVPARAQNSGALVDVVQIEGIVDRQVADYLRDTIAKANADDGDLVAIELDTPGGLGVTAEELVQMIATSEVPVLTFVPPSSRATSAGAVIAQASHILAMSPVSRMGAAAPVDLGSAAAGDELAEQMASLAERRGRNPEFAAAMVRDARVLTVLAPGADATDVPQDVVTESDDVLALGADEVLEGEYADVVEPGLNSVLERLSGYEVALDGGATRVLSIDGETAQIRFNSLGLIPRILHTVANPTLAYLLVISGALALAFEVFQPGFGVAGVSGLALASLGLYGLTVLPVNWWGVALVVVGLVLLTIDLAVAGLGALTVGGALALGLGSFLSFGGPPILRPSPWVLGLVVLFTLAYFVVILTTVLRAQGSQAITGAEGLVGQTGVVRSVLNPEGHVYVRGALWRARAPEEAGRVRTGSAVRVLGVNDALTLEVEPVQEPVP